MDFRIIASNCWEQDPSTVNLSLRVGGRASNPRLVPQTASLRGHSHHITDEQEAGHPRRHHLLIILCANFGESGPRSRQEPDVKQHLCTPILPSAPTEPSPDACAVSCTESAVAPRRPGLAECLFPAHSVVLASGRGSRPEGAPHEGALAGGPARKPGLNGASRGTCGPARRAAPQFIPIYVGHTTGLRTGLAMGLPTGSEGAVDMVLASRERPRSPSNSEGLRLCAGRSFWRGCRRVANGLLFLW